MLWIDEKSPASPPEGQILTIVLENCENSAVKHFKETPILLNFVDLSTKFCPWLHKTF